MPSHLGSFFSHDDRNDATASISGRIEPAAQFSNTDIAAASAATSILMEHDGHGAGEWENPMTGARGTITPLATPYRDNGIECRDFLASYVRDKAEAWMQGEACRNGFGHWVVRDMKAWRR
jgi:surface antigen